MNSLLKRFLAILKELEPFERDFSEDATLFTGNYLLSLSIISDITSQYEDLFENSDVSFELFCERILGYNSFKQSVRFLKEQDNLELKLIINKQVKLDLPDNTFIFFKTKCFFKHFDALNNKLFEKINIRKEILIYLPSDKEYSNSFVKIIPIEDAIITPPENLSEKAKEEVDLVKKIYNKVTRDSTVYRPLPNYYKFDELPVAFKPWFDQNLFHSSLLYLSNKLSENKQFVIRGHKNTEISLSQELKIHHATTMFNVYCFCYDEKHFNDKIEIARNIFTIYLNSTDTSERIDELLPKIEKTIENHFSAYIQDSIKKFFNDRKDVVKEAHKFGSDLKAESDKLLTYINTSLIGVITAIFSGALGMSKGERWYLIFAFALHALLFIFSYLFNRNFVEKRKSEIENLYEKYTSKFVILAEDDLKDIKNIYIMPAVENINSYLQLYKRVIIGLVLFMSVLILIGILLPNSFFMKNENSNPDSTVTHNVYSSY